MSFLFMHDINKLVTLVNLPYLLLVLCADQIQTPGKSLPLSEPAHLGLHQPQGGRPDMLLMTLKPHS